MPTLTSNAPPPTKPLIDPGDKRTDDETRDSADSVEKTDLAATRVAEIVVPRVHSLQSRDKTTVEPIENHADEEDGEEAAHGRRGVKTGQLDEIGK